MNGMICHDPAWLFALCKPRRIIGSPGAQRGLSLFSEAAPNPCQPPCQEHCMCGKKFTEVVWKGGQVMGSNVMITLPSCCAGLWLLPSCWREAALPCRRQPSALPRMQCRSRRWEDGKGRPLGGGNTTIYLSPASKPAQVLCLSKKSLPESVHYA